MMEDKDVFTKSDFEHKKRELHDQLKKHEHARQKAEAAVAESQRKLDALTVAWDVLHGSNGHVQPITARAEGMASEQKLSDLPDEFSSTQFRDVTGMSRGAAFNALKRLEQQGKIVLIRKGKTKTPSVYKRAMK